MIRIENLRKEFDQGTVALDDISMDIREGELIALLGPSGCGKSTTLNCMAGLLDPTGGHVFFDDVDVTGKAPRDRNIGMCFQSYALYPHMKVIDNIAFPLKQKGVNLKERREKAVEIAKKLQIEHLLLRKPAQLSGGQQQRVAMCRALIKEPKVLLLDEPMSNLDARLKIEIREVIKNIQQELKVTSILVTHDQEEAMAMADRIAILDNGRIQQYDTPDKLYEYPSNLFVANFMGNPPMNFIDGELVKHGVDLGVVVGERVIPMEKELAEKLKAFEGREVKLGVRSHQAVISSQTESTLPMKLTMVENLGKELLVTGSINKNHMRITVENTKLYAQLKEKLGKADECVWVHLGEHINVFDTESKENLVL